MGELSQVFKWLLLKSAEEINMNGNRRLITLVSLCSLVLFAYISAYYPQYSTQLVIAYIVLVMGLTMIFTGKQTGKTLKDIEYILNGKKLFEVGSTKILKLKERDKIFLKKEVGSEWIASAALFLPLIILVILFFIPSLRNTFLYSIVSFLEPRIHDINLARFFAFLAFFGLFVVVSYVPSKIVNICYKSQGKPYYLIPSHYIVTDRGIIINRTTPLKFPLKAKAVKSQGSRKIVDIVGVKGIPNPMGSDREIIIRLYCDEPKKLAELLRKYLRQV